MPSLFAQCRQRITTEGSYKPRKPSPERCDAYQALLTSYLFSTGLPATDPLTNRSNFLRPSRFLPTETFALSVVAAPFDAKNPDLEHCFVIGYWDSGSDDDAKFLADIQTARLSLATDFLATPSSIESYFTALPRTPAADFTTLLQIPRKPLTPALL